MAEIVKDELSRTQTGGEVLTRSLEQLLQKLIRLLVGRLSLVRLQEMIRQIYVQAAERQLKVDFPEKRVTLSQLALLTGVDTRTLTKLTNSEAYAHPMHENEEFLSQMMPETRIISVWMSDPRFFDYTAGKPYLLSLESGSKSFANLVSKSIGARGLTLQSILSRLDDAGSVKFDRESDQVELITNNFYPFLSNDESAMLEVGFSTAASLFQTVANNIERATTGEEKLFQRSAFTHRLSPKRQEEFRRRVHAFLAESDSACRSVMSEFEDKVPLPGQITAGVSMFYFEKSQSR